MTFALLAVLAWGLWGLWGKLALERGMPSHAIPAAEGAMGFLCGLLVLAALRWRGMPPPWHEPWNAYGFLSGAALAGGIGCYYLALRDQSLSVVVPLTAAYPVVAVLLAMLVLGERPTAAQWAGIALTVGGVMLLLPRAPA